MNVLKTSEG